ncbi:GNAT family N-acetyltransferase [Deinococcus maricopensis]|uniref:GCN5-related N-acetyltransferase n=1 Tax=Deinococcus maricopensis (strain DSM 21211 / LMG 22137 / NRRL B-23946 / LB-34) TaxID=709986 RepID=E8U4V8_DEIML|nr:GNAT family N-acetyltransferase [Deinococcus maricopensis]ADV66097.1 GCN5-related N-acetyltransferase [Deinococcus maricopensis DSM 21211]
MPDIRPLHATPETLARLRDLLIVTVAEGGSVGFMHPLTPDAATAFWDRALSGAARGERIILGAWEGEALLGTVTLILDCPPNQPHRAEIAKMMTHPGARRRGAATALLQAAEALAVQHARTLLVLDTASDGGASSLYERLGFVFAGEIPDYALKPHGGLTGTRLYYKRIGSPEGAVMAGSGHAEYPEA